MLPGTQQHRGTTCSIDYVDAISLYLGVLTEYSFNYIYIYIKIKYLFVIFYNIYMEVEFEGKLKFAMF